MKKTKIIFLLLIISFSINLFFFYQMIFLNRRAIFSDNILIDSNYILENVLNNIKNREYQVELKAFMDQINFINNNNQKPFKLEVPLIDQTKEFPNGCEGVSATMLLQYFHYDITPDTIIDQYIKKEKIKIHFGQRYGPDPGLAYAGDPRSKNNGFGCFSPVIENALNKIINDNHKVLNLTGYDLEILEHTYVKSSIPIMIWATVDMQEITKFCQWKSFDQKHTYLYPATQHALVLIGSDQNNYYFNDPLHANNITSYPKELVNKRFQQMGKQAIAIIPKDFIESFSEKQNEF